MTMLYKMVHARDDYQKKINKPITGGIGLTINERLSWELGIKKDEPVLWFRGQDKHFPAVIQFYIDELEKDDGQPAMINALKAHKIRVEKWQQENGCKKPDI